MTKKIRAGIVDDNTVLAAQLKENLSATDHIEVVFTAVNGEEAISKLLHLPQLPEVILMDIEMPVMNGIEDVLLGGAPMSPHIAAKTLELLRSKTATTTAEAQPKDYNLSERETEILLLLTKGHSYQQIANDLFISHGTVRKHVENIYGKLHVNSKAQAVSMAHKKKWV